jgi:hypothetical protein
MGPELDPERSAAARCPMIAYWLLLWRSSDDRLRWLIAVLIVVAILAWRWQSDTSTDADTR